MGPFYRHSTSFFIRGYLNQGDDAQFTINASNDGPALHFFFFHRIFLFYLCHEPEPSSSIGAFWLILDIIRYDH